MDYFPVFDVLPIIQTAPMTYEEYNNFCSALPHTTHVIQWGGSHVWKVGGKKNGKVFAIRGWDDGKHEAITFKVSENVYELLRDAPGCRPAPYLASRGMKWIQHYDEPGLSDKDLKRHLEESHRLASLNLTKKLQKELGLNQD